MASKKGYLKPEIIDPLTRRCVTFYVPDETWWLAAFWGQMTALADVFMWEGTEAERDEIVAVWAGVLSSARQNFDMGDCELTLEFRSVGGRIEYRPYATAGWIDIGVACPCPAIIPAPEYNPDIVDPAELACNVAVGIIEWLMQKYNDTLDQITAASTTAGAFDAIFLIFPPAYLIADIVLDAIQEVINATVSVARAYDTVERREDMQEWLYCMMIGTGEMTSEIWSDFKQAFIDDEFGGDSPGRAAMYLYLQSFEEDAILARARIESYGSGNCVAFSCNTWSHTFDFTLGSQLDWVIEQGVFASQFNSHFIDLGAGGGANRYREIVQIKREWAGLRQITSVKAFGARSGVPGSPNTNERRLRGVDDVTQKWEYFTAEAPDWTWIVSSTDNVNELNIRLQVSRGTTFSGCDIVITKVVVEGIGADPF